MPKTLKTINIKIPQIARWRIAGISDTRIAQLINMSHIGLAQLLATQDYKDYEAAYMEGHLSEMDKAMAGKVDEIRNGLRSAVPAALRCLVDSVTQRRDMKTAFAAAKEILDRDPDRVLPVQTQPEDETVQTHLPIEVLDAAMKSGNDLVEKPIPPTTKEIIN